jgi:hypothetical protein
MVWLSPSCVDRLRRDVSSKYPSFKKGWLSQEVENFINQGLANYKKEKSAKITHTHSHYDEKNVTHGYLIFYSFHLVETSWHED